MLVWSLLGLLYLGDIPVQNFWYNSPPKDKFSRRQLLIQMILLTLVFGPTLSNYQIYLLLKLLGSQMLIPVQQRQFLKVRASSYVMNSLILSPFPPLSHKHALNFCNLSSFFAISKCSYVVFYYNQRDGDEGNGGDVNIPANISVKNTTYNACLCSSLVQSVPVQLC